MAPRPRCSASCPSGLTAWQTSTWMSTSRCDRYTVPYCTMALLLRRPCVVFPESLRCSSSCHISTPLPPHPLFPFPCSSRNSSARSTSRPIQSQSTPFLCQVRRADRLPFCLSRGRASLPLGMLRLSEGRARPRVPRVSDALFGVFLRIAETSSPPLRSQPSTSAQPSSSAAARTSPASLREPCHAWTVTMPSQRPLV